MEPDFEAEEPVPGGVVWSELYNKMMTCKVIEVLLLQHINDLAPNNERVKSYKANFGIPNRTFVGFMSSLKSKGLIETFPTKEGSECCLTQEATALLGYLNVVAIGEG